MAISERQPQPYHEPDQEHEITLFVGEDRQPVGMACYEKERFYIGGLRAQLETVEEDTIVFAVTVETAHQGWITRRYGLTGEQFYHLFYGSQQPAAEQHGLLEATTRLAPPPDTSGSVTRNPSGHKERLLSPDMVAS